ncbi:MAG TPA: tetratricopeptide repeat protein [Thermoplasmata archaeon]|nr:tetratricopeptide repeat protein [Thermoplasmata archaeon]
MPATEFSALVAAVAEAMDQRPDALRGAPEGLLLHTTEGFLFAFIEHPEDLSLAGVHRLLEEPSAARGRLVVLTPQRMPLALADEVVRRGGTVVAHDRFRELLRGLDLGQLIGEEPRGPHDVPGNRLLPSARHLDAVVARARTWLEGGVPALALRFYRQALAQKPEFVPARIGVGRSLAALGLEEEALGTFREVLAENPTDVEARLGEAAVHAAAGRTDEELRIYRQVLEDRPDRLDVRAQLMAAEMDAGRWPEARAELERMLKTAPEDPRLRFLHAVTLERTGASAEAPRELERARSLGLSLEAETALCGHLGLPPPPPRPPDDRRSADVPRTTRPARRAGASGTGAVTTAAMSPKRSGRKRK